MRKQIKLFIIYFPVVLVSCQTITTNIPTTAGRETGVGIVCTESTTTATAMCDLDFIYTKFVLTR